MGFHEYWIRQALEAKAKMKADAEAKAQAARRRAEETIPALRSVEETISRTGASIAITALDGGDLVALRRELERLTGQRKALLEEAGFSEEDFEPRYQCSRCRDTGADGGKWCGCVEQLCRKLLFESMTVTMPLEESSFDRFQLDLYPETGPGGQTPRRQMSRILAYCKNYAETFGPDSKNLLFLGNTGLGKTHLSLAVAGRVIAKGYGVIYGAAVDLFGRVEQEHFAGAGRSTETLDLLLDCDLLILDDLGTEFVSSFSRAVLNQVVNARLQSRKPTIISTNFSLPKLEEIYDSRLTSRLGGCYVSLLFQGDDLRVKRIPKP